MTDFTPIDLHIGERVYRVTAKFAYHEMVLTWGCKATVEQAMSYGMSPTDAIDFAAYAAHRAGRNTRVRL